MTENILFHNPRCSKSRQSLEMLESRQLDVTVKKYLSEPMSSEELAFICNFLKVSPVEIIRTGDKKFQELGLSKQDTRSDGEWIRLIRCHPELLQRPILIYQGKVAIGRPPENILTII